MVIKKPYLLTGGLVPLIENRHKVKLSPSAQEAIRHLERMYFSATVNMLSGRQEKNGDGTVKYEWDVQFMSDEKIDQDLRLLITENKTAKPLISFDDVYCQDLADANYHVTRLQDPQRLCESPKLGPRFANPSLDAQIDRIRKNLGLEADVMDIGVFGGDTLVGEINRFKNRGVNIRNIFVMFAGQEGIQRLAETGSTLKYVKPVDWIDWLEMRDCIGFDGRKIRMTGRLPNCAKNSFVRYTERSESWASIPAEFQSKYGNLYNTCFETIKAILACDGVSVELKPSRRHEKVYDLNIERKAI